MGTVVGAFEAKNRFSNLLRRAGGDEKIAITHRGRPVAELLPVQAESDTEGVDLCAAFRRVRKQTRRGPESLRELLEEGRHW